MEEWNLGMNRILILSKNILAEQEIQKKLQGLNYEVYCSVSLIDYCKQKNNVFEFIKLFNYVILSDSICESEVSYLVPLMKEHSLIVIREVGAETSEVEQQSLEEGRIDAIISNNESNDDLRECLSRLENLTKQTEERSVNTWERDINQLQILFEVLHRLSQIEAKILTILISSGNQVVKREDICEQVWQKEVSKSHLVYLSSAISRIKNKFKQAGFENVAIYTLWGKGYIIDQKLLHQIKTDSTLTQIVSKYNI